jgi:hypothetical protein
MLRRVVGEEISGRIELGSWNGRDVEEKGSQSRAAAYTCS